MKRIAPTILQTNPISHAEHIACTEAVDFLSLMDALHPAN
jgi:hypothetical protein